MWMPIHRIQVIQNLVGVYKHKHDIINLLIYPGKHLAGYSLKDLHAGIKVAEQNGIVFARVVLIK